MKEQMKSESPLMEKQSGMAEEHNSHIHISKSTSNLKDVSSERTKLTKANGDVSHVTLSTESEIILSKNCLSGACDLAQRSAAQLLTLRKDSHVKLSFEEMSSLWQCCLAFVAQLEDLSGTSAYVLRNCLNGQAKSFLERLHDSNKNNLVHTLDNERWTQFDVSNERQQQIERLVTGKAFLLSHKSNNGPDGDGNSKAQAKLNDTSIKGRERELSPVWIESNCYKVVWSVQLLAEILILYIEIAAQFPPFAVELIQKTVELLRLFDSRTRLLVLGAGAIASARLKSISAKHLSVTAQSLSLVIALLPHIRTALLSQLPPKHQIMGTELDRVQHEYEDHRGLIVSKFVSIVSDAVDIAQSKCLSNIDWDRFQGQCEYFEKVHHNVAALHRVLSESLPATDLQHVFQRIFSVLVRKIPSHFEEIMPSTQTGRQRILDEVTHMITNFSRLKIIDCTSYLTALEDTFRRRYGK
jgi:vacuolar protein sorting-associated protein 54